MNPLVNQQRLAHTTQLYCVYEIGDASKFFYDIANAYQIDYVDVCWISLHAATIRLTGGSQLSVEKDIARWAVIKDYQNIYPDGKNDSGFASFVMNIEFTSDVLLNALLCVINPKNYEWIVADQVTINGDAIYLGLAVIEGV